MKRLIQTLSKKWPEYLLEIFVITIGILGAFALNNWNENSKVNNEEQSLYRQLLLDYEANLQQLDQKVELHHAITNSGFAVHEAFDRQDADLDSLLIHLSVIGIDPTFDPISNDLTGSGQIHLIRNPELNRLLSNWDSDLVALREVELAWQGRVYNQYLSLLIEMGIERDVESNFMNNQSINNEWLLGKDVVMYRPITRSKTPPKSKDILSNKKLEGIVAHGIMMNQGAIEQSLALKKRIEKILELLNLEMEK